VGLVFSLIAERVGGMEWGAHIVPCARDRILAHLVAGLEHRRVVDIGGRCRPIPPGPAVHHGAELLAVRRCGVARSIEVAWTSSCSPMQPIPAVWSGAAQQSKAERDMVVMSARRGVVIPARQHRESRRLGRGSKKSVLQKQADTTAKQSPQLGINLL